MRNIRLTLEYDGTHYHGWQFQPAVPTIQGALEEAIFRITGEKTRAVGAGRTDAGTHAMGQVAHFFTNTRVPLTAFTRGLNSLLPPDIVIVTAGEAPPDFDARRSARSKVYRYTILNREYPAALKRHCVWWVPEPLDHAAMTECMRDILGEHDFSSFQASDPDMPDPHRNVLSCSLVKKNDMIVMEMEADSFLKHMVRIVIGTLADIGRGRVPPSSFRAILEAGDRTRAGATAPAHGLCLVEVKY